MKKIHILTSLATLGVTAATIAPLTSCNTKSDLTEDQWHTAINKLWDVSKERNFTMNAQLKFAPWDDLSEDWGAITLKTQTAGFNNYYSLAGEVKIGEMEPWVIKSTEFMIYHKDDIDWLMEQKDETWNATALKGYLFFESERLVDNFGTEFNPVQLWKLFGIIYGWYDAYEYNSGTKEYKFNIFDSSSLKLSLTLKLDDNKNISNINGEFYLKTVNDIALHATLTSTLDNYGSTSMPAEKFKQTDFDTAITEYWNNAIIETTMDGTQDVVESTGFAWEVGKRKIFIFKPSQTNADIKEYKYFYSTTVADGSHKYFVDGKKLVEGTDFTDLWGSSFKGAEFSTPVRSDQTIVAILKSADSSSESKVRLTNTKV